jgi:cytochrome P450
VTATTLPPPVPAPRLAGSAFELLRDPVATYRAAQRHGDLVTMRVGPPRLGTLSCLAMHPEGVQHVLAGAAATYVKQDRVYGELRQWFGDGLLTVDGPRWQAQRRTLQPLFTARQVAAFAEPMLDEVERVLRRWTGAAAAGEPVDLHEDATVFALRLISRVLLGGDADSTINTIAQTYPVLNRHVLRRLTGLVPSSPRLPFPQNLRAQSAKDRLFGSCREVVRRRVAATAAPAAAPDLLDELLNAEDPETGRGLSEDELVSQVVIFLLAGHETSATAMTATLHLLALHPEVQEELHDELRRILGGRGPQAADVPRLGAVARVFHEALRLQPPVWGIARSAGADDVLDGHLIPEGMMVVTPQCVTHVDPRWWEEPRRFRPARWTKAAEAERPRYAWFPFGGGPRACIGRHFALQETVLLVASTVQRFRIHPMTRVLQTDAGVTLRPRSAVLARLEPRL